jgi:hypothetical protein
MKFSLDTPTGQEHVTTQTNTRTRGQEIENNKNNRDGIFLARIDL